VRRRDAEFTDMHCAAAGKQRSNQDQNLSIDTREPRNLSGWERVGRKTSPSAARRVRNDVRGARSEHMFEQRVSRIEQFTWTLEEVNREAERKEGASGITSGAQRNSGRGRRTGPAGKYIHFFSCESLLEARHGGWGSRNAPYLQPYPLAPRPLRLARTHNDCRYRLMCYTNSNQYL
jgi:hypothetical protein